MLIQMLEENARRHPERTALRWRGTSIRWDQLSAAARARADELERAGIGEGDGVAILLPNSPDFVASFLAAASLGAVAIPLDPNFRKREIEARLADVRLAAILCTPEGSDRCTAIARKHEPPTPVFVSEPHFKIPSEAPAPWPRPTSTPDLPVLYGFSSGTTGTAKRITRTQGHLAHEAAGFTATTGVGPDDRILGVVPFFHAHGLGNCILAALRTGAALVVLDRFERRAVLDAIQTERVTIFPTVPFQLQHLAARDTDADLSSLRLCFTAGTALPVATFEQVRDRLGIEARQLYGCTEAGSVCINLSDAGSEGLGASCESVGRPIQGVEIAILDERRSRCGPGVVGEVALRSPAAGCGYAGLEALNQDVFQGGWFRTGDLGSLDEDGRLRLCGRTKLFIDVAAGKVDPVELERCATAHPSVVEAAAVGVPTRSGAEIIKLVVAVGEHWRGDESALRREIIALCREDLAEYKLPRIIEARPSLPRNAAGKMIREKLIEGTRKVD